MARISICCCPSFLHFVGSSSLVISRSPPDPLHLHYGCDILERTAVAPIVPTSQELLLLTDCAPARARGHPPAPAPPACPMAPSLSSSTHYALVIDAGSSGSRLQIYSWRDPDLERAEIVKEVRETYAQARLDASASDPSSYSPSSSSSSSSFLSGPSVTGGAGSEKWWWPDRPRSWWNASKGKGKGLSLIHI